MTPRWFWSKVSNREPNMERLAEIRFSSTAEQLYGIRCQVRNVIESLGFGPDEVDHLVLAVNEACMNIIQHAYNSQPNGEIILEVFDNQKDIMFRLTDFAAPVDKSEIKPRDLDDIRPGGLGVHLIQEVMDEVEFRNDPEGIGNILIMRKRR